MMRPGLAPYLFAALVAAYATGCGSTGTTGEVDTGSDVADGGDTTDPDAGDTTSDTTDPDAGDTTSDTTDPDAGDTTSDTTDPDADDTTPDTTEVEPLPSASGVTAGANQGSSSSWSVRTTTSPGSATGSSSRFRLSTATRVSTSLHEDNLP